MAYLKTDIEQLAGYAAQHGLRQCVAYLKLGLRESGSCHV